MIATASQRPSTRSSWWLEYGRDAGGGALREDRAHVVDAAGIEAGERLVEDQQLRLWTSATASWARCWLPWESASIRSGPGRTGRAGRSSAMRPSPGGGVHAVQPREVLDLVEQGHGGVESAFFWHVAEGPAGRLVDRPAAPRISPASRAVRPKMARIVVVLPAPFGPRKPKTCPAGTPNDSPSSAVTVPYRRRSPSISSSIEAISK